MVVIPAEIHVADTTTTSLLETTSTAVSGRGSGISNDHVYLGVKNSMLDTDHNTHLADYTV
jgi:hypothetical protein